MFSLYGSLFFLSLHQVRKKKHLIPKNELELRLIQHSPNMQLELDLKNRWCWLSEAIMMIIFMENCDLRVRIMQSTSNSAAHFQESIPFMFLHRHCPPHSLQTQKKGVHRIQLKEMCTGRVNERFPWLLSSTVTRHHFSGKQQSALLLPLETFLNSDFAQRAGKLAGKWKTRPVTHQYSWNSRTKFSSTFSFCQFSPSVGRLASGRTSFFFFFSTDFRSGLAADWLWFEAGKEDRCSGSPAGLLQPSCSALENRKRSLSGSHFSHQLVLEQLLLSWDFLKNATTCPKMK